MLYYPSQMKVYGDMSLHQRNNGRSADRPLVRRSIGCWAVEINWSCKSRDTTFSRTKWKSISTCLVHPWKTRYRASWIANWLSHSNRGALGRKTNKSRRIWFVWDWGLSKSFDKNQHWRNLPKMWASWIRISMRRNHHCANSSTICALFQQKMMHDRRWESEAHSSISISLRLLLKKGSHDRKSEFQKSEMDTSLLRERW